MEKKKIVNKAVLLHYYEDDIEMFRKYTLDNDDKEQLYNLAEFELKRKLTEEEVARIIVDRFDLENASDISIMSDEKKKEIVKSLKNISGTTVPQLSRVIRLTEYFIKKTWK